MARAVFFPKKPKQGKLKRLWLFQAVVLAAFAAAGAFFRPPFPFLILGFCGSGAPENVFQGFSSESGPILPEKQSAGAVGFSNAVGKNFLFCLFRVFLLD